ncbi:WD40 repeat domain-containing protein [Streptomyces sp. TLI_171]|uniref:WD40 repeat domain-containing protein n=1 Tax=Streptomyces sp. TLI_171 TaxID=1938859 RepID=UPI000C1921BF|nr:WD40 repeat domain-containing protein [Streptomyces sp. TLI_171]RKE18302.1 hypothetical protein BX266_1591 [Streptomyces sp. TLI_171]
MEPLFADSPGAEHPGSDDFDRRQSALFDAVRRGKVVSGPDTDLWQVDWASGVDLDPRMVWHAQVGPVVATAWGEVDARPVLATAVTLDGRPPGDPKLRHRLDVRDVLSGQIRSVECEVPVRVLAFAPDAEEPLLISGHKDNTLRIWALADLAHRRTLDIGDEPHTLAVLGSGPDTRLLLRTSRGRLRQWDPATGASLPLPDLPTVFGLGAGSLVDGSVVLLAQDDALLWTPDANRVRQLPVPPGIRSIRGATLWRSAGRQMLTVHDTTDVLATIDLTSGQHTLLGAHSQTGPDGLMATEGRLSPHSNPTVTGPALAVPVKWQVNLWDVRTMRPLGLPLTGPVARADTAAVRWQGRDLLMTSSRRDGVVALWDPAIPVDREPGHRQGVVAVSVTEPDGTVVSVDEGGTLVARRAADGTVVAPPVATDVKATNALAAWTDHGRPHAATGSGRLRAHDPLLYRWDLATGGTSGAAVRTGNSHIRWIAHQRLRTGDALVVHGYEDIALLDPSDGTLLAAIPNQIRRLSTGFAVGTIDGRAFAGLSSHEKPARLHDLDDPSSGWRTVLGTEGHHLLALLDGRLVTVRSELPTRERATALRTWDRVGRSAGAEIDGPAAVTAVAGRAWPELYVARADRTLSLVDLRTGEHLARPLLLPRPATCLATTVQGCVVVGFGHDLALVRPPLGVGG